MRFKYWIFSITISFSFLRLKKLLDVKHKAKQTSSGMTYFLNNDVSWSFQSSHFAFYRRRLRVENRTEASAHYTISNSYWSLRMPRDTSQRKQDFFFAYLTFPHLFATEQLNPYFRQPRHSFIQSAKLLRLRFSLGCFKIPHIFNSLLE